jgi:hypothetical protein
MRLYNRAGRGAAAGEFDAEFHLGKLARNETELP